LYFVSAGKRAPHRPKSSNDDNHLQDNRYNAIPKLAISPSGFDMWARTEVQS